jgi:flagellar motor switch protein FliG
MAKQASAYKTDRSGREKAAMLLIALGPDSSSLVLKHLKEEEIEQLTLEIANIRTVSPEEKEKVLEEFYQICLAQDYIAEGGINYAKEVLEKALGSQKALDIINKLTVSLQVRPFDFVRKADAAQLLNSIQNEHPQTIALILAYLRPSQASAVISSLPADKQADVARRIAIMDRTSPEVIKEVERLLEKRLSSFMTEDYTAAGGIQAVVDMLNNVDRGTERSIMEILERDDMELAEEIRKRMFVFEDILSMDNRSIQRFLREVDSKQLAIALKGATEEVQKIIYLNVSKRLGEMIKEDIEFMGPVRLKDVEDSQQKIVNIIRKLEETGEIVISRGGGDEIIV